MDVLLSLPIASYLFFSSSLTSWSTSINLLFFYMTWSTLILSHSALRVEVFGTAAIRTVLWLLPSLAFLLFDTLVPSLAESLKFNGRSALPPRDPRALASLLGRALFNLALETGLEAAASLGLALLVGAPPFRASTTVPLPLEIIRHVVLLFLAREVLTYYIHRYLLHHPQDAFGNDSGGGRQTRSVAQAKAKAASAARRPATLHERYAHERRAPPFSLLVRADNPLPHLLHRFVPVYLPALALSLLPRLWRLWPRSDHGGLFRLGKILGSGVGVSQDAPRLHLLTYFVFLSLATLEDTLAASGYSVLPGIIVGGVARRTAAHYCRPSDGNFSPWGLLDWVHGTSLGRDLLEDVRDEAEKHGINRSSIKDMAADRGGKLADQARDGAEQLKKSRQKRRGGGRKSGGGGGGGAEAE